MTLPKHLIFYSFEAQAKHVPGSFGDFKQSGSKKLLCSDRQNGPDSAFEDAEKGKSTLKMEGKWFLQRWKRNEWTRPERRQFTVLLLTKKKWFCREDGHCATLRSMLTPG